jgi:glycosyltransferase involved in cell wall biosynthesis
VAPLLALPGRLAFARLQPRSMPSLRLALVGAFAFPAPLGSQRFFAEQAAALATAGAELERFTYAASGATLRGFDPRKLAADRALGRALVAAHRRQRFDAVLAHNAEAALVARWLRRRLGVPVVYVAHTLWAEELETWLGPGAGPLARSAGRALDRALARSLDALLVLSEAAQRALAPEARGPLARIAPGHTPEPAPAPAAVASACARHGLAVDGFALYAGNLDRYQALDVIDEAAAREPGLPVVVATHDARRARFARLRVVGVVSIEEMRCLVHGAAVALLPRRSLGGFPIKLLHAMEAGRAILARRGVADTLVHGESAWLVADGAGPEDFAGALRTLAADPALRARLGAAARSALAQHHAWPARAEETLALVRAAIARRSGR